MFRLVEYHMLDNCLLLQQMMESQIQFTIPINTVYNNHSQLLTNKILS